MTTYLETVQAQSEAEKSSKLTSRLNDARNEELAWTERLTPLEDRLSKLLSAIPFEIKSQGVSLHSLRNMLAGKWRGRCHPGELGIALRKLGYQRRRSWSDGTQSFSALWYPKIFKS